MTKRTFTLFVMFCGLSALAVGQGVPASPTPPTKTAASKSASKRVPAKKPVTKAAALKKKAVPARTAAVKKGSSAKPKLVASTKKPVVKPKAVASKRVPSKKKTVVRKRPAPRFVAHPPVLQAMACSRKQTQPAETIPCVNCAEQALSSAYTFTGLRYKRGGSTVETGFDCSGFVRHVFVNSCDLELPRTAREQYQLGQEVAREDLQRGDLVFFRSRQGWHVGIYTGDGQFIHSPNRRSSIKVSSLYSSFYKRTYLGARRLTSDILPPLLAGLVPPFPSFAMETEASGDN